MMTLTGEDSFLHSFLPQTNAVNRERQEELSMGFFRTPAKVDPIFI